MIHLMLAEKIKPAAPTEYFIGNIAPDAIAVRTNHHFSHKDRLHFRGSKSRLADIESLAREIDISSSYNEGYIMHLFLDMHWDMDCMIPYIAGRQPKEWVLPYRLEISRASAWLYDNTPSLNKIWSDMISYDKPINAIIQSVTYDEVKQFYALNRTWNEKYRFQPSDIYPTKFLDEYTDMVAQKYTNWRLLMKNEK